MQYLRGHFESSARRNLYLTAQLLRVLDILEGGGVLAIPYKGPVLARLAYGDRPLREFGDLDLIVRSKDVLKAHQLLQNHGFRPEFDLQATGSPSSPRIPGQYLFVFDGGIAELHSELTLRYFPLPLDLEALSSRLQTVSLAGREVRTFSVEDSLPILCVHASKHFWDRLMWVCDIAELVQNPAGVNWERVEEETRRLGCERMLFLGLCLAHELLDAPLPEGVLCEVEASSAVRAMAAQVSRRILREDAGTPAVAQRFLFRLRMREHFWDGLRYVLRLATSPTEKDWEGLRLPKWLAPLYPALRPLRLVREYGWRPVRQAVPDVAPSATSPLGQEPTANEVGQADLRTSTPGHGTARP
jgi:hypothetical protein